MIGVQVLCGAIFVPLFFIFVVLYGRIGHFLWVRSPIGTGNVSNVHLAKKKRVAWALFWLIFWFFFCRMPNWIFVMVTMFQEDEHVTSAILMTKSTLVFLSVLNTVVNPWLYSQLNEPLKKTIKSCSDQFCGQSSIFKSCCGYQVSLLPEQASPKQKVGPHRQNEQRQQSVKQRPERHHRSRSQVEPVVEMGATARLPPINNEAIFTVSKVVQADVTRSSSKNGKTRQTTVLTVE